MRVSHLPVFIAAALCMPPQSRAGEETMSTTVEAISIRCFGADSLENVFGSDDEVTEQYRLVIAAKGGRIDERGVHVRRLPALLPGVEVFVGGGWYAGGHRFYPGAAIARHDSVVAVVEARFDRPPYIEAVAFSGNHKREIERKRNRPDLDLTPLIIERLQHLRDTDSLNEGTLLELTYLLAVIYHAKTNMLLVLPLDDVNRERISGFAATRGWVMREGPWSPPSSGLGFEPVGGADAPTLPRYSCTVDRQGVKLQCAAQISTTTSIRLQQITFESDYDIIRLNATTVVSRIMRIR